MVYVRGVELTGKTETFELESPYSSSLAYAGPFFLSGYLEECPHSFLVIELLTPSLSLN